MAEDCWNLNRVLWSDTRSQSNVERLPLQYPTQRVRQKAARRTSPTALAHDPIVEPLPKQGLTDRQLFYAVFQDLAATEEGHAFFDKLTTFFRDEHLDNFEQHQDFLEFLRKQPEELLQIDLRDCLRRYFDEKGAAA